MVLTAVRPGEARGARWEEIDFGASEWTIPATRMKAAREHRVPLCARAVEVLHAAERLRQGSPTAESAGLVFPSAHGKQLADARLSKLLDQLGIGAVPHGFRSSFRDWASERTNHPREVVEAALAHVVRNQTEAAYARSDLFDRRRQLMNDWMQFLDPERGRLAAAATVTVLTHDVIGAYREFGSGIAPGLAAGIWPATPSGCSRVSRTAGALAETANTPKETVPPIDVSSFGAPNRPSSTDADVAGCVSVSRHPLGRRLGNGHALRLRLLSVRGDSGIRSFRSTRSCTAASPPGT